MSGIASPRIVTNGLVLALDAANKNSYSGTGATWIDLSGNRYNGTLINSPTFSAEVNGCFSFDGTSQYINFGNVLDMVSNDISGFAWVNVTTHKNYTAIIDKLSSGGNYRLHVMLDGRVEFGIRNSANTYQSFRSNAASPLQVGTWYYLGFTHNITSKLGKIYINGILDTSNTFTIDRSAASTNLTVGYATNNLVYAATKQSTVSLYNRELSADEVLRNYNATKTRFGL